jgi:tetratricopeptide (TPR) repeat protein
MTLLVYLPALHNDFVNWDDDKYVFENPFIRSFSMIFFKRAFLGFFASNWHPLTWMSHAVDYAVWGLDPFGHHLTSIVLHAFNSFLVVIFVILLLEAFRERTKENGPSPFLNERAVMIAAGTTGLLFGIHPLHVESVAWVSERKDLLCALFFLLSVIAYTKYVGGRKPEDSANDEAGLKNFFINRRYFFTLGFFILALLSKPMAVTLPVVLLILDWYPFGRIRSLKTFLTACVEKLPFIALSLASSIITILGQAASRAMKSTGYAPFSTRIYVAANALIAYFGKMLLPLTLVPYYPYPKNGLRASFEYLAPIVLVAVITAVSMIAAKKQKIWLSAWGYYAVTLLPVIGIVQVGLQAMADRYTYLPSLGPFLVTGLGVAWLWEKAPTQKKLEPYVKLFLGAAAACMVFFLSIATIEQSGVWKNSMSLWTYVIEKEPDASLAYNNRGMTYDELGRFDQAIEDFARAIELAPRDSEAYSNRGMLYEKMGRLDKAIEDFEMAITLNPARPASYNNLGIAYAGAGLVDKAFEQFNKAILLDQDCAMAYNNRGLLYETTGDKGRAAADYRKACDLDYDTACNALK